MNFSVIAQAAVIGSLLLVSTPVWSDDDVVVTGRGTDAVPIKRNPARYPAGASHRMVEGWVVLSYVVDTDGTTRDIEIIDASIEKYFDRASRSAVEKWIYKPATFNGKPVPQAKTRVRLIFMFDDLNGGVSRKFLRLYRRANKAIIAGELEEAKVLIERLEARKQSILSEVCYLDILRAMYWQKKGDERRALGHFERALTIADDVAEEEIYITILKQAIVLNVRANNLVEALRHYDALVDVVGELPEDDQFRKIAGQVKDYLDSDKAFATQGTIHQHCSTCKPLWHHTLYRNRFSIDEIDGTIDEFKLLCGFKYVTVAFSQGMTWNVEDDWGQCDIHIYGDIDTTFRLIEH